MSSHEHSVRFRPTPTDIVVMVLAVTGFLAFLFYLPRIHPDATARYSLTQEEVIDRANIFLATQGFSTTDLFVEAMLTRQSTLLEDMQSDLGRSSAIDALKSENGSSVPAYYWRVQYQIRDPRKSDDDLFPSVRTVFTVNLTQSGVVWALNNTTSTIGPSAGILGSAGSTLNLSALASAMVPADSTVRSTIRALRSAGDSLLLANLRFERTLSPEETVDFGSENRGKASGSLLADVLRGRRVALGDDAIVALAKYHAPDAIVNGGRWEVDSIQVLPGKNARLAMVRLSSRIPEFDQNVRADVTVAASGSVQDMQVDFNPERVRSSSTTQLLGVGLVSIFAILGLALIIVFFRRVMARLIDVKSALLDGIIIGSLFSLFFVLERQNINFEHSPFWLVTGVSLLIFSIVAGGMTLLTFMLSGVSESIVREVWPKKIFTMTLLRRGEIRNTLFGASLLRGIGLAGILLGVSTLFLVIFPDLGIKIGSEMLVEAARSPLIWAASGAASQSYLATVMVLLGLGTFVKRFSGNSMVVVVVLALTGGLLHLSPVSVETGWYSFSLALINTLVLAMVFIRFDFYAAFTGLAVSQFVWTLAGGFLVPGSPAWLDAFIGVAGIIFVVLVGIAGVLSRKSGLDAENFVPDYITELAGQERVKRELEIARQVQASFLPRTMPHVPGLDLAGMCLPATEVGGDYFDFIELSGDRLAFVVGDVSGKGTQAAFYMTLVKGMIQTLARMEKSPAGVLCSLNDLFRINAPAGTFISLIYGVVDVESSTFTFARAGHNPAIFKRAGEIEARALQPRGMAIGFTDAELFNPNLEEVSIQLQPGDTMVFYTDGFSEAMNTVRELYGDDRLVDRMGNMGSQSAGAILRSMTEAVHHFIEGAGRADDMTMVVIKIPLSP